MDVATVQTIVIPLAGVIIPAAFTYLGVRLGNRLKRREIEASAPERARAVYEGAIDALQEQLDELRKDRSADREELASLRARVLTLEEDRARDRRRIADLIAYVRTLQRVFRDAGIEYPVAPASLELDVSADDPAPAG
jgi:septal ring factor EnvC (AmiA/AmiB activator)